MRIRVQVVIEGNEDVPPAVHEVADLRRAGRTVQAVWVSATPRRRAW